MLNYDKRIHYITLLVFVSFFTINISLILAQSFPIPSGSFLSSPGITAPTFIPNSNYYSKGDTSYLKYSVNTSLRQRWGKFNMRKQQIPNYLPYRDDKMTLKNNDYAEKENLLRSNTKNLKFFFYGKNYDYSKFKKLIDEIFSQSLLNAQINHESETELERQFDSFMENDIFEKIVRKIAALKTLTDCEASLKSNEISNEIYKLPTLKMKIYSLLLYGQQLQAETYNESYFILFLKKSYDLINKEFPEIDPLYKYSLVSGFPRDTNTLSDKKINLLKFVGDYCTYHLKLVDGLEAYLRASLLAWEHNFLDQEGIIEYKISELYSNKPNCLYIEKSLFHIEQAVKCVLSMPLYNHIRINEINQQCFLFSRDGNIADPSTLYKLIDKLIVGDSLPYNTDCDYYYYQALGHYFSSTGIIEDLSLAKIYYQAAFLSAYLNIKGQGDDLPQIKTALTDLFWIYSNLDLKKDALHLLDLAMQLSDVLNDKAYKIELLYDKSYIFYNLGHQNDALKYLSQAYLGGYKRDVYNNSRQNEIGYLIWRDIINFKTYPSIFEKVRTYLIKYENPIDKELTKLTSLENTYENLRNKKTLNYYINECVMLDHQLDILKNENYKLDSLLEFKQHDLKLLNNKILISDSIRKVREIEIDSLKRDKADLGKKILEKQNEYSTLKSNFSKDSTFYYNQIRQLAYSDSLANANLGVINGQLESTKKGRKMVLRGGIGLLLLSILISWLVFKKRKHDYDKHIENKNKQILKSNTHAAISQVLARNMSHNIGSHVLSKFNNSQDIEKIYGIQQYVGTVPNQKPNSKIASFNEYLKCRMDFLSDISMADPILETPYNFFNDVLGGMLKNPILLDRISGIQGEPKYELKMQISKNRTTWKEIEFDNNTSQWMYDIYSVSMPNDVLGCHAFYIIIENIIRNTYKHSQRSISKFEFNIRISPSSHPDLMAVQIFDNNYESRSEIDKIIKSRNEAFRKEIIDTNTNKLRTDNLGTIEMEVCAAYLRKISLDKYKDKPYTVNDNGYNTDESGEKIYNIIRAYPQNKEGDPAFASLGYELYLLRPKEVLIVSENLEEKDDWKDGGVDVVSPGKFGTKSYPHQIILHEGSLEKSYNITPRCIEVKTKKLQDLNKLNAEDLIEDVWDIYGKQLTENRQVYRFMWGALTKCYPEDSETTRDVIFANHRGGTKINEYIECSHHKYNTSRIDSENITKKNIVSLVEMIQIKVCIIDERIQSFADEKSYSYDGHNIKFKDYFPNISIKIPRNNNSSEPDLNQHYFGNMSDVNSVQFKLKEYLKASNDCDFIIIHLGIVEKMLVKKTKDKVRGKIMQLLDNQDDLYKKIIFTTSRTVTGTIPDDCRYLPLSAVQHCVETTFDKFLLVKALFNSRKPSN